jgi:hypothetical protein
MDTDCLAHRPEEVEWSTSINTQPRRKLLITEIIQHQILRTFDNAYQLPISKGSKDIDEWYKN